MARQSQILITIPQPCNIPWDGMTPVDTDQRHCSSCDKVITDFSKMSDDELMLYFRHSNGNMCGRFSVNQINRPFQLLPDKSQKAKWWRTFFLFPLLLFGKSAKSQAVDAVKISNVDSIALSENPKIDSVHSPSTIVSKKNDSSQIKTVIVKHKKHHRKKEVGDELGPFTYPWYPENPCVLGGVGMQINPYSSPFITDPAKKFFDLFGDDYFPPQQGNTIRKPIPFQDLTDKKETPHKPQQPALPSSDPLTGILPEQKKQKGQR
jgi:hypothetical protein